MAKLRNHNEWFRMIDRPKHCPTCGAHNQVWSWGEYRNAKWRTVKHFCEKCFGKIRAELNVHAGPCGCKITLVKYGGGELPAWLSLKDPCKCVTDDACSGGTANCPVHYPEMMQA